MPTILCNCRKCEFNHNMECTAATVYCTDTNCKTYSRIRTRSVMQPEHRPLCHKSGGKYKSDHVRLLK